MKKIFFWIALFFLLFHQAQTISIINQEKKTTSYRGISIVNENIFWISGSKGTIGKTTNGGKTFTWFQPKGFSTNEFRDIQAKDSMNCYAMAITEPATLLQTKNGGKTWKKVYKDKHPKAFIDAIDCHQENCYIVGDALEDSLLYIVRNIKNNWKKQKTKLKMKKGEAFFAASGSNIKVLKDRVILVSGGKQARLIYKLNNLTFQSIEIPMIQGKETTGPNGFDYDPISNFGIIVGGDFNQPNDAKFNLVSFQWNNQTNTYTFNFPNIMPKGYRSGIAILNDTTAITCGLNGVDISYDKGKTWEIISKDSYHAIQKIDETTLLLVGNKGKIGILKL